MNTLFDISPSLPEGFRYMEDFITPEEETKLINLVAAIDVHPMQFHQYEAKRKVASFGLGWSFTRQRLEPGNTIPEGFDFLVNKVALFEGIHREAMAQFLVTEYPVGAVINWHRDAPPFDTIIGVSLAADCIFKLRPHEKEKQHRKATISLPVKRRSLYVMKGPAKNEWQHSTMPVNQIRYSLTFRTVKNMTKQY
jgi:alkylated DNA repair dioxygenase AlkB